MNIVSTPLGNREVEVTVEISAERFTQAKAAAARELAKKVNIPGFRRGKAPLNLIVRHYGEGVLVQQAVEDLAQKLYKEALDAEKLEPGAMGEFVNFDLEKRTFIYKVPLIPLVNLGDYREMRVYFEPAEIVDEVDVENELNKAREAQAVIEPVERPAQFGDLVTLKYQAVLAEDDEFEVFGSDNEEITLTEDAAEPAPGFHDEIVGLSAGQTHQFELKLPADYSNLSLAEQVVKVNVTVETVKGKTLPDLDDSFAAGLADGISLVELKERVLKNLQAQRDADVEREYGEQVLAKLLEQATVEYPPAVLKEEVDGLVQERTQNLKRRGLSLADYLRIEGKTEAEFRESLEPVAANRLNRALALRELARLEQVRVSQADLNSGLVQMFQQYGIAPEAVTPDLIRPELLDSVSVDVLYNKALQRLSIYARGETPSDDGAADDDEAGDDDDADADSSQLETDDAVDAAA